MSQSRKKENILFAIFLSIIILIAILITFLAIKNHNANNILNNDNNGNITNNNVDNNINKIPVQNHNFNFKEVSKSETVDAFTKYPVNPIEISFLNNTVSISGLKNKEVEAKINKKLSVLDSTENENGYNYCDISFNFSNVLSISCRDKDVSVNLINGEDIILEEIFQKDSDIISFLWNGVYENTCLHDSDDQIENCIARGLNIIKNGAYSLSIRNESISLNPNNSFDYSIIIEYSAVYNDLTIYNRFLTEEDIYLKDIKEYCNPRECYVDIGEKNENHIYYSDFLNEKNYLNISLNNITNFNMDGEQAERQNLNLEKILDNLKKLLINKYNLNSTNNNYKYISISASILSSTNNYNHINYEIAIEEYNKEDFKKYLMGDYYLESINKKEYYEINIVQYFDNSLEYLENNPSEIFSDFETTLYNFILNDLETNKDKSEFAYAEQICGFVENIDKCEKNYNYIHELIKNSKYSIDVKEQQIYLQNISADEFGNGIMFESDLPFNIFTLKTN